MTRDLPVVWFSPEQNSTVIENGDKLPGVELGTLTSTGTGTRLDIIPPSSTLDSAASLLGTAGIFSPACDRT